MNFPLEVEKRIQKLAAIRRERIGELQMLWARLCRLKNEEVSSERLHNLINEKFQVGGGLSALEFESIEIVKNGLLESIAKLEKRNEKAKTITEKRAAGN